MSVSFCLPALRVEFAGNSRLTNPLGDFLADCTNFGTIANEVFGTHNGHAVVRPRASRCRRGMLMSFGLSVTVSREPRNS